jgi:ketosteroid isomerase-like protein
VSQENVGSEERLNVMRMWFDTWNRTEFDAFFDLYDADAELVTDPSWVEAGPFNGRAAIRAWFEGLQESWEARDSVVLGELFEAGDRVVVRFVWHVRGRTTGIDTHLDATSVNTIKRGKIVHQQYYFDHDQALKAIGLSD